jgi:DNA repair exonuclease SbcCD ATPase subunit
MKYLKTAFLNHWNLLAFLAGTAFALLSVPDVVLPLVAAGELAYIALLGSHPKFQQYVDAQEAKALREASSGANQQTLEHIMKALPPDTLHRFQTLRAQCAELRQIATELKRPGIGVVDAPLDDFQLTGLDRLLWIHLRLLYTQYALSQFLRKTSADQIKQSIEKLEQQIQQLPGGKDESGGQRFRAALEDNLQTSRARLANLDKARENYQLVGVEIDRLENKIRSLSEMAVNRQEPEFISSEVDHVATSMMDTEKTMNELQFATGLNPVDNEPPELLRAKVPQASQKR